jgi:hypothetical protein
VENKLHELGMTPNEIITLVRHSAFNKYQGRSDEERRLKQELEKIISGSISDKEEESEELKVTSYEEVMSHSGEFAGWLVKGFWGRRSHGIVAGMPKSFKSTLVHDLVVSVASGKPFLGKYPVMDPGPVVVVQNENADYVMRDRSEKLIASRGLCGNVKIKGDDHIRLQFPPDLPIHFVNQQGFMLTDDSHKAALEKLVSEVQPVLVVLDPLYLMFDNDLNLAKDLSPVLNWLLHLKNEYKTSVMVVHHYNKGNSNESGRKGGSRMMGSVILYGWIESAWYLSREGEEQEAQVNGDPMVDESSTKPSVINMSREFRMAGRFPDIDIHIQMGEVGNPYYHVDVTISGEASPENIQDSILNLLQSSTVPMTRAAISEQLGLGKTQVKGVLDLLFKNKKIVANNGGFTVYKN